MKLQFATSSYPAPVSRRLALAKYALAGVFVVIALAQLFAFEDMGAIFAKELGLNSSVQGNLVAVGIVLLEVCAVASLIEVALSPAMRLLSRLASMLAWVAWYLVVLKGMLSNQVINSGLLGDKVSIHATLTLLMAILGMLIVTGMVQYRDLQRSHALRTVSKGAKI